MTEPYVPFATRERLRPSALKHIGLLALLTGATALFAEVALTLRPDVAFPVHVVLGPLAIVFGVIGVAVITTLGVLNRIGAVVGLALGIVATLLLAAPLIGTVDGVRTFDQPWSPTPAQVALETSSLSTAATAAQSQLAEALATTGAYPAALSLASPPPVGTRVSYTSDGGSYALILIGEFGGVAQLDSTRGIVLTGTLVP